MNQHSEKARVAIVKYGGMSAGGTEKFLRNLAIGLERLGYQVRYFYCDASPYLGSNYKHSDTNLEILEEFSRSGVELTKFHVKYKDIRVKTHDWVDTDFFEKFDESSFDLVITGRAGHPEFPFTQIRWAPIIDTLHLRAGIDDQINIVRVLHLSSENANYWINRGGDRHKVLMVSHPIDGFFQSTADFRSELGISTTFVIGFHQRPSDEIFSDIPLKAFAKINKKFSVSFVLLGGSKMYRAQAESLKLENVYFLEESGSPETIDKFLNTLDIYAHGRRDGEINSTAIAEALKHGLPVVTHRSIFNNGHADQICGCGYFAENVDEYAYGLEELLSDPMKRAEFAEISRKRFEDRYEFHHQLKVFENIVESVLKLTRNTTRRRVTYLINRFRLVKRKVRTVSRPSAWKFIL